MTDPVIPEMEPMPVTAACDRCGRGYLSIRAGGVPCMECGHTLHGRLWRLPAPEFDRSDDRESRARRAKLLAMYRSMAEEMK